MGGACSMIWGEENAYRLMVGKRQLGTPRRRWVDNIKMDLGDIGWGWCRLDSCSLG
jgi:hypothetical protein